MNLDRAQLKGINVRMLGQDESQLTFEQLKLFQDYTKWHVSLYAGGSIVSLALTQLIDDQLMLVPLFAFLLAASCAGTLLGNLSRFRSEAALNVGAMRIFGGDLFHWCNGKLFRRLEKGFFWLGVGMLVGTILSPQMKSKGVSVCVAQVSSGAAMPAPSTCVRVVLTPVEAK